MGATVRAAAAAAARDVLRAPPPCAPAPAPRRPPPLGRGCRLLMGACLCSMGCRRRQKHRVSFAFPLEEAQSFSSYDRRRRKWSAPSNKATPRRSDEGRRPKLSSGETRRKRARKPQPGRSRHRHRKRRRGKTPPL